MWTTILKLCRWARSQASRNKCHQDWSVHNRWIIRQTVTLFKLNPRFIIFSYSFPQLYSFPIATKSNTITPVFCYTNIVNVAHRKPPAGKQKNTKQKPMDQLKQKAWEEPVSQQLRPSCLSTLPPTDDDRDRRRALDVRCYLLNHRPIRAALDCITSSRLIAPNCALFCLAVVNLSGLLLFAFSSQW